jgi:hypothetical protein
MPGVKQSAWERVMKAVRWVEQQRRKVVSDVRPRSVPTSDVRTRQALVIYLLGRPAEGEIGITVTLNAPELASPVEIEVVLDVEDDGQALIDILRANEDIAALEEELDKELIVTLPGFGVGSPLVLGGVGCAIKRPLTLTSATLGVSGEIDDLVGGVHHPYVRILTPRYVL